MTAPSPLTWPTSRVLAGWWSHLDRFRPRCLWLYHLLLHRIEAPVSGSGSGDRLARFLLEALASAGTAAAALARRLHLDAQILGRLLGELEVAGLVIRPPSGEGDWAVSATGRAVLAGGREANVPGGRRTFYFAEGPGTHPGTRFLPLDRPPAFPRPETEGWQFDVGLLRACAQESAAWKGRHGFPADVGFSGGSSGDDWRQVILDRPEQLLTLFVLSGSGSEESLLGLAVSAGGWQLQVDRPVLALGSGWREVLPELAEDVGPEQWRQAWRGWGQPRGWPVGELEACLLERKETSLLVRAPQPLVERLRIARSEVLHGETWLLGGADRVRVMAQVELTEL